MPRSLLLSLTVGLALLVTACGGGGGAQSPGGARTGAPTGGAATDGAATDAAPTGAAGSPAGSPGAEVPDPLVLGLVPSREADVLVENAQPLADYLGEQLGVTVESYVPQNYPGLVSAMRTGQAHIGAFGPFGLIQSVDEAGAEIILQSARDGAVTYHTQWMTNDPT
jgi:phosphonate transport system substrate-binding protein